MSAKVMLAVMVASTALVVLVGARPDRELDDASPLARPYEVPWLTSKAAAEIVGSDGGLGPLFGGLFLGGSAPSREDRARIAEFAGTHGVEIELQVVNDELVAVRFAVTFGGCCGYEGADVLGMRMRRPHLQRCCGCGREWIDDWAVTSDSGTHMRARVRVNRVSARWERAVTLPEVVARADGLLGKRAQTIARGAGDHWKELDPGHYLLEVPYLFVRYPNIAATSGLRNRDDLGLHVRVEHGAIAEVSFKLEREAEPVTALNARWGRPRIADDGTHTWRRSDRVVTAEADPMKITIAAR